MNNGMEQIGTYSQSRLNTTSQYLLPIFKNLTILQLLILMAIIWISGVIIQTLIERYIFKHTSTDTNKNNTEIKNSPRISRKKLFILKLFTVIIATIICFACICFFQGIHLTKIAKLHGHESIKTMTIQNIYDNIEKLPIENKLPENLKNKLIIYYKFGCGDCESIHNELQEVLHEYKDVYIIYTRSKQGKELRKTYPVEKVPSGMYIQSDGTNVTLPLYSENADKEPVLDRQNLDTLLKLFQAGT